MTRQQAERKARRLYGAGAYAQAERGKFKVVVVPGLAAGYGGTYREAMAELAANAAAAAGETEPKINA